jgi:membrane-bound serine protease (ClpP class)
VEVTDPTVVFLLIALGLVGIGIEVLTPGGILPAVIGVFAIILGVIGIFSVGSLTAGMGFLLLAVGFFVAAAAFRSYRFLSILGVLSLIFAGIFMFNRDTDPTSIPIVVIGGLALGGFMMFVMERASLARGGPVRAGPEELVGMIGEVRVSLDPTGQVFVDGGLWQAELAAGQELARPGEKVRVEALEGLTLRVSKNLQTGPATDAEPESKTEPEGG